MSQGIIDPETSRSAPPSPIAAYLDELLERHAGNTSGEVATYIPELAGVDPGQFGICIATVDGAMYESGDTRSHFTVQSISKPLTYGLALELAGEEAVRSRVGVEPSGDPFNEISLDTVAGTPVNPMINAGAITCAGIVHEAGGETEELLLRTYSTYAGRRLAIDEAVYRSEAETGHRNRAIAHLLAGQGVLSGDPGAALDLYFRQCSVEADCRDVALIAATLANGGINPVSGERAVREDVVRSVLSVMTTCGMYDGAGEWLVSVGIPAKSGVSGGVLGVLPGRLGVAVFSPRVDEQGNSVRGVAVCRDLSRELGLHLIRPGERSAPAIRASCRLGQRSSKRQRTPAERAAIRDAAAQTAVFELQGDLDFMAAEAVSRSLVSRDEPAELVVIDLRRVSRIDRAGTTFLTALAKSLRGEGGRLAVSAGGSAGLSGSMLGFDTIDLALEWCEDELLARGAREDEPAEIPIERHRLLEGLTGPELELLLPLLGSVAVPAGSPIVSFGEPAAELYLVVAGQLSVLASDSGHRLTTLSAGMTFGELAYVERGPRSADVLADTAVECRTLPYAVFDELAAREPQLYAKLLRNILGVVTASLHLANAELAVTAT